MTELNPVRRMEEIAMIRRLQQNAAEQEAARMRRRADQLEERCRETERLIEVDHSSWLATVCEGEIRLSQAAAWSHRVIVREADLKGLNERHRVANEEADACREIWARAKSREDAAEATADQARKDERRRQEDFRQSDLDDQTLMRMRSLCE